MTNPASYLRFLSKNKTLNAINILGFSIGIAACIFIGLYVSQELSYDGYHKDIDRIFSITTRLTTDQSLDHIAAAALPLAPELTQNYPEVEEAVRFKQLFNPTVGYQNAIFKEKDIFEADAKFSKKEDILIK
jgi:putative ABC transport system permease protein